MEEERQWNEEVVGRPQADAGTRGKRVRIPATSPPDIAEPTVQVVRLCACTNTQLENGSSCGLSQCPNMAYFPSAAGIEHPLPEGARVHHRAGIRTKGKPDLGGPYWGRIVQVLRFWSEEFEGEEFEYYEYDVLPDGSHSETVKPFLTIWEEHHIDEVL